MSSREEFFSLAEDFLEHLNTLHRAPGTVKNARRWLALFGEYLEGQLWKGIREVTPRDLEGYVRYLLFQYKPRQTEALSGSSAAAAVSVVRKFFQYLLRRNVILIDPSAGIPLPKVEKRPKLVLTVGEMEVLLSAPNLNKPYGLRDRAILELLYSTGLRVSELVRLNLVDLSLNERLLRVNQGKGGKDRMVPFGKAAHGYLSRYLNVQRPVLAKKHAENAVFLSHVGGRLNNAYVQRIIRKYSERARIQKKISPHSLRHTCATHLLEGGADIRYIQELLGHASPYTTQIYARSSVKNLKEVHSRCHPRGRMKRSVKVPE